MDKFLTIAEYTLYFIGFVVLMFIFKTLFAF